MRTINPEQQAERREQILDAAVTAFARQGLHRASMTDIAAAAGMSAGNLYRYFTSKEAIIKAMAERERQDSNKLLAALAAAPDLVQAVVEAAAGFVLSAKLEKAVVDLEIAAETARNPELAKPFLELEKEAQSRLAEALHEGQRKRQVSRTINPMAGAQLLINLSYSLSISSLSSTAMERCELAAEVRRLVRAYLNPESNA